MEIELRKIEEIRPYERNPRINENAVDAVAKSIKEFGFRQAIVVDADGVIVCGHTRWKAAQKLGLERVPVHVARDLSSEQLKAYRLADNKCAELSEWNYELLPLEIADLQAEGFDLSLLGFDSEELDKLLNGEGGITEGQTEPDVVPEVPDESVSKRGEIYQLGRHRLMCGDSTNGTDVEALMNGEKADLLLTDAPYNVAYEGEAGSIQNDDMSDADFLDFLTSVFKRAHEALKPGASFYIYHSDSEGYNFRSACVAAGLQIRQCLVWVKDVFVMGRQDYQWCHEPILRGWKDGAAHSWYSDRSQTTVLEFNRPKRSELHPTMKPVEMLVYLIKNSSKRDDLVLDLFGGSGSTLIAAEQTGRRAFLMEIDEKYCDVIRQRWAEFVHGEGCDWQALTPSVTLAEEHANVTQA